MLLRKSLATLCTLTHANAQSHKTQNTVSTLVSPHASNFPSHITLQKLRSSTSLSPSKKLDFVKISSTR